MLDSPPKYCVRIVIPAGIKPVVLPLRTHNPAAYAAGPKAHANLPREEKLTTATADDAALRAAAGLALKVWDLLSGNSPDKTEFRQAAVTALFASKQQRTRSRLVSAGRDLAYAVIAWVDDGGDDADRAMSRASQKYERLRVASNTDFGPLAQDGSPRRVNAPQPPP